MPNYYTSTCFKLEDVTQAQFEWIDGYFEVIEDTDCGTCDPEETPATTYDLTIFDTVSSRVPAREYDAELKELILFGRNVSVAILNQVLQQAILRFWPDRCVEYEWAQTCDYPMSVGDFYGGAERVTATEIVSLNAEGPCSCRSTPTAPSTNLTQLEELLRKRYAGIQGDVCVQHSLRLLWVAPPNKPLGLWVHDRDFARNLGRCLPPPQIWVRVVDTDVDTQARCARVLPKLLKKLEQAHLQARKATKSLDETIANAIQELQSLAD